MLFSEMDIETRVIALKNAICTEQLDIAIKLACDDSVIQLMDEVEYSGTYVVDRWGGVHSIDRLYSLIDLYRLTDEHDCNIEAFVNAYTNAKRWIEKHYCDKNVSGVVRLSDILDYEAMAFDENGELIPL